MGQSRKRSELHDILQSVIGDAGKVYFQPPEDLRLSYPCIVYTLSDIYGRHADDMYYTMRKRYNIIVIDHDPDSTIAEDILRAVRTVSFDRRYMSDNLYHDSLTVYW